MSNKNYLKTEQILLGLEEIYPEFSALSKSRFAMETLSREPQNSEKILEDFSNLVQSLEWIPHFSPLKPLLFAKSLEEKLEASLRLNSFLLESKLNFNSTKSGEEFEFFGSLQNLLNEDSDFLRIKKILDLMNFIFEKPRILQLKKAYEHYVSLDSDLQFLKFLNQATGKDLIDQTKVICHEEPQFRIHEALSKGQVKSKLWARDEMEKLNLIENKRILLLCGWVGLMGYLLQEKSKCEIISVDLDQEANQIANRLNKISRDWGNFNSITENIFNLDYDNLNMSCSFRGDKEGWEKADVIVHFSCEHIENFGDWYASIPDGQLLVLQSNDFFRAQRTCKLCQFDG